MAKHIILFCALLFQLALSAPTETSLVVSSTETPKENGENSKISPLAVPIIYEMDVRANISNRFAKALVTSKVRNPEKTAQEATFTVVLPDKAFISEFVMEIGGKSYKAYVKEKEEAKKIYDQAVASGQTAAHVAVSARDSNRFTVSVNIEPEAKAVFLLTYEELLERRNNQYELVLNIHPGQVVKKLNVEVNINETKPLKFVKTPALRTGNEISKNEDKLDPSSDIQIINSTSSLVKFSPDAEKQKQFAHDLGTKESDGFSGQFVVQYDVERDSEGGEVLLQDGFFVHFFAPKDLEPLPKHAVFVLDTSGSMYGDKIDQLKAAMKSILGEITDKDILSIVDFSSDIRVWDIIAETTKDVRFETQENYNEPFNKLGELNLPSPVPATSENIVKAKNVLEKLYADGGTHMIGGLDSALYLVKREQTLNGNKHQPIIIFLTDGYPNGGTSASSEITDIVTKLNAENNQAPIFALSFGSGADKQFLRKLSLQNFGFSRHIYEAADATLQLIEFYKQISSPLLSKIKFKYESEVEKVTQTEFPIYFGGSELVVTGRYQDSGFPTFVECVGPKGPVILRPIIKTPVTSLERLWAYLTVKQTLEQRDAAKDKTELTKKALDLALRYSFVTDVSSLVVVRPNATTSSVDTEEGDRTPQASGGPLGLRFGFASLKTIAQNAPLHFITSTLGPPTLQFTNAPIHESTKQKQQAILNILTWLSAALNPNQTISLRQGVYELGDDSLSFTADVDCPMTPISPIVAGHCTLIKDCPEVHSLLTSLDVYQDFFCPINNRFAGVCCPKSIKTATIQVIS